MLLRNFTLCNFLRRQDLGGSVTTAISKARTYVRARTKNYKSKNYRKFEFAKQLVVPIKFFNPFKYWTIVHCLGFCPYLNKQTEILVRFIKNFKTVLSAILAKQLPSGPFFAIGTFIFSVRLAAAYFLTSAKENYSVSTLCIYIYLLILNLRLYNAWYNC